MVALVLSAFQNNNKLIDSDFCSEGIIRGRKPRLSTETSDHQTAGYARTHFISF
jgi:hypothetical protein